MISNKKPFIFFVCTIFLLFYLISNSTFPVLNHAHAQINKKNNVNPSLEIIIPLSSSTEAASSNNNKKISFDATIDNTEWKNAKQFFFSGSNNIDLGKLYLQYNVIDNALEGAFVIPNSVGGGGGSSSSNDDMILHLLFDTFTDDNNANMKSTLNPNNDHRIDISKNIQQARYFIGNGTNGWNVERNSMQGNNNITMKMNEPFDKMNIITSTDAQKWTGEFKIYFVQQASQEQQQQQQQSNQQQITMPIKKVAIVQENSVSGNKVTANIPSSPNISLTDPLTWAAILTPNKNTTATASTITFSASPTNQQKNQTPLSNSSTEKQQPQPLSTKTNNTLSKTTAASNNTSNTVSSKTTPNTGSSGTISSPSSSGSTSTPPPSQEPQQNPFLNTSVIVALITTIGGVIGTITAAIIANKNKNKSS